MTRCLPVHGLLVLSLLLLAGQPQLLVAADDASSDALSKPVGYNNTPVLPGSRWRVHDIARPVPHIVTPGTASTQRRPGRAPSDAIVLFDGTDLSKWVTRGRGDDAGKTIPAKWKVENGYMEVNNTGSIWTADSFGDCQLHLEFATPSEVKGSSQGRGNSGVIIMQRYEIQVLDSYNNRTYADGQAAAIYGQYPPLVNAARKPGQWQTYDILFEGPRFEGDALFRPAYVTVLHNGVVAHHRMKIIGRMAHKLVGTYAPHPPEAPLLLQAHGNPTRYRNIWIRPLKGYDRE